jgi:ABC-2 type transport system ATP-binding protein
MKGMINMEIVLKNISKEFDKNIILKDVNLKLESGKIYGFTGRNGSGKSVLLKIICGFYKPTGGSVIIEGHDIIKEDSFLPDTRVLIEKPTFLPDQTGFENLKLLAAIQNKITDDEINKTLDLVNLSVEDRNKKYHKYSLGMKQKLGIAQVLMENPNIMIFDEPFNGIESVTVEKIKQEFISLKNKGKLIIISSHIKEDIDQLADEIYEFKDFTVKKI